MKDAVENKLFLLYVVQRLKEKGSWCGETHIQKNVYFLQKLVDVLSTYNFILYKHGPFSFDLRDELTAMRADGLLVIEPKMPYGSSYSLGKIGEIWLNKFHEGVIDRKKEINHIIDTLADKKVKELEKLATALYVREKYKNLSEEDLAKELQRLKPHVNKEEALVAVEQVNNWLGEN